MKLGRMKQLPGYAVLVIITLIAALALGATFTLTEERIVEQNLLAAEKARAVVMPEAEAFQELPLESNEIQSVYQALREGEVIGYVAKTTVNGYGGEIEITAGFTPEGIITGISVGGANFRETPGLGAKSKDASFTDRFIGKTAPVSVVKAGKPVGANDVDAIASATVTSASVANGVNAMAAYISKTFNETEGA